MKKTPILPLAAVVAAAVAVLAGCTNSADTTAPSASTTASADSSKQLLDHRNECVDGKATITKNTTLEKGCDEVAILADDLKVTLGGTVTTLYVEGKGNSVTAETIGTLHAAGSTKNTITYTGADPDVKDAGTDNSITKK